MLKTIFKSSLVILLALIVNLSATGMQPPASRSRVSYNTYCNARYGYCVDVPTSFKWEPEAGNGDGRYFRLNKNNYFCAYAMFNVLNTTIVQEFNNERKPSMKLAKQKDNWYVLSYKDSKGLIHYKKVVAYDGGETYAYLEFTYDEAHRKYMDPIVTHIASGFNGQGWYLPF